ncbi:hypothetical protein [Halorientalis persicus]|uniref:hypothetical protein n=1 Tax=Halorientalis persicus TaxID=1367881 RepID=UPI001113E08C|nr:hypothetical protein [Halorientalis persicus]
MTDGGETNNSTKPDYEVIAGEKPARDGSRRLVPSGEGATPYKRNMRYRDELAGITLKAGTRPSEDSISFVALHPHNPKRSGRAVLHDWLARIGVNETKEETDPLHAADTNEPPEGYEKETTEDYRNTRPEDPRGDGVYKRDSASSPLTDEIADAVTRAGGRLPCEFSARVQNEGYARFRDWTVYAPGHNPYHVAAAVTDLLRDSDGVNQVDVTVADQTAEDLAKRLRSTRFGYIFDSDEEELVDRAIQELRWESGLGEWQQRKLEINASPARQRIEHADLEDETGRKSTEQAVKKIGSHPGDAWDHHTVHIHIAEEATNKHWA